MCTTNSKHVITSAWKTIGSEDEINLITMLLSQLLALTMTVPQMAKHTCPAHFYTLLGQEPTQIKLARLHLYKNKCHKLTHCWSGQECVRCSFVPLSLFQFSSGAPSHSLPSSLLSQPSLLIQQKLNKANITTLL